MPNSRRAAYINRAARKLTGWRWVPTFLVTIALVGCQPVSTTDREAAIQSVQPVSVQSRISGRTVRFYDGLHGTQFEYFAPSGSAYLWYAGNSRAVVGSWRVRSSINFVSETCFTYPPTSFNPVTGASGGRESCRPSFSLLGSAIEYVEGDPLHLSSGQVPGILPPRSNIRFSDLRSRFGLPGLTGLQANWQVRNAPGQVNPSSIPRGLPENQR